ncbi:hypothetical protein Dsin_030576 [Dipteronia sinensis]|uniref:RNase H type-1 domain-containing protein n=1 Tax=Dipteronia sinensis TaxID=43782 RepID=A0AAE0DSK0_9ROSI|nr:hypothetical protein Dsin_030576 [Dipteronia sinensis]
MASSAQKISAGYDSLIAEAMAVLKGLQFSHNAGLWPCVLETDAQVVVNLVKGKFDVFSEVGLIIEDINRLLHSVPGCVVNFVPRNANMAAHNLAKLDLSLDSDCFWMEEVRPSVVPVVLGDCPI